MLAEQRYSSSRGVSILTFQCPCSEPGTHETKVDPCKYSHIPMTMNQELLLDTKHVQEQCSEVTLNMFGSVHERDIDKTTVQQPQKKVWRFALMPPWASRHIGGSRQGHPRYTDGRVGRPWVARSTVRQTRTTKRQTPLSLTMYRSRDASSRKTKIVAVNCSKNLKRAVLGAYHASSVRFLGFTSHEGAWNDEGAPEQRFDFNEGTKHAWSDMETPSEHREHITTTISPEVRRSVRQACRGLGHTPFNIILSMLRLGGASNAALEHAKRWRCLAASRPKRPMQTQTRLRSFSLNGGGGLEVVDGF